MRSANAPKPTHCYASYASRVHNVRGKPGWIGATMLLFLLSSPLAAIEKASYTVLESSGDFELRRYDPQLVVETKVDGGLEDASNQAFRSLFNYISGENQAQAKIAMTAPVSQDVANNSEKIEMTAPVAQSAAQNPGEDGLWRVNFLVPARFTMETAPLPTNPDVYLREVPAQRMATIRYSGRWTRKNYHKHLKMLEEWMAGRGLQATGEPVWARYDPPFKPWFMRRNEILIPVDSASGVTNGMYTP